MSQQTSHLAGGVAAELQARNQAPDTPFWRKRVEFDYTGWTRSVLRGGHSLWHPKGFTFDLDNDGFLILPPEEAEFGRLLLAIEYRQEPGTPHLQEAHRLAMRAAHALRLAVNDASMRSFRRPALSIATVEGTNDDGKFFWQLWGYHGTHYTAVLKYSNEPHLQAAEYNSRMQLALSLELAGG